VPNTELPIDLENQVVLMKKYVNFRQRKKLRDFLGYAGYFRASRYGKYLLTQVNAFGSKADAKVFFELYDFDVQLRLLLFKYCKKAEVYFKCAIANAISLKTGDAGFYLDKQYYTPTKSEKDKKTRNRNVSFFNTKFFAGLTNDEEKLRRDVVKHSELKEYRRGGLHQNNVLPVWAAFSYFEMGTIVMLYSYLRGDLRKEVLDYTYPGSNYKKEVTKQMDTWLDAVRNLRNYCAHHSMVAGMTSSVVIPDNKDSADVLPDNTNLYSRLYALKKILPQKDADLLATELDKLISKTKLDIYKMNILPANWKELYEELFDEPLTMKKPISQIGEFASNQTLTIKGPKGTIERVRILGPERGETQVEISKTDSFALGIKPPVRNSGDLDGAAEITIIGPKGEVTKNAAIIASRHVHATKEDAKKYGFEGKEFVSIMVKG